MRVKYTVKDLITDYPEFCKKWGIDTSAKKLGEGSYGVAYSLGSDKVLKITEDDKEAKTSAYLSTLNLKYTWKVYFAGQLDEYPIYVIIGEKLERLGGGEVGNFYNITGSSDSIFYEGTLAIRSYPSYYEFKKNEGINFLTPDEAVLAEWEFNALKELKAAGIKWEDNHEQNIMKNKDGVYKFIDLGQSRSPEGQINKVKAASSDPLLEQLCEMYPKFCKSYNITPNKPRLGSGSYGVVYDLGNGSVLKLTADDLEGSISAYIRDLNLDHVWKVYFSGELVESVNDYKNVIIGEKLEPLSGDELNTFQGLYELLFNDGTNFSDFADYGLVDFEEFFNAVYEKYSNEHDYGELYISLVHTEEAEWEFNALNELRNYNISWEDNHENNIMKDSKGNFKFIDLGRGHSPKGGVDIVTAKVKVTSMVALDRLKNLLTEMNKLKARFKYYQNQTNFIGDFDVILAMTEAAYNNGADLLDYLENKHSIEPSQIDSPNIEKMEVTADVLDEDYGNIQNFIAELNEIDRMIEEDSETRYDIDSMNYNLVKVLYSLEYLIGVGLRSKRVAKIVKEKGKYCVKSEKNPDWSGGCYDSKQEAQGRLNEVEMFKHMKSSKNILTCIVGTYMEKNAGVLGPREEGPSVQDIIEEGWPDHQFQNRWDYPQKLDIDSVPIRRYINDDWSIPPKVNEVDLFENDLGQEDNADWTFNEGVSWHDEYKEQLD
jgi:hypothetical protein